MATIDQLLQNYRDIFTKYKSSFITQTDSQNVETLNDLIKLSFEEKTIVTTVLLGPKGSGKKKTLQLAVNKNFVSVFISINCLIYNTPVLVYEKLLRECEFDEQEISQNIRFKFKSNDKIADGWLKVLSTYFNSNNVVLYFSNFERITKQKQAFFYGLIDGINLHASKCFLCFSTSSLTFWDILEKRIKSRFSFTLLYFGLENENILTFLRNFINNSFESCKITDVIKIYLEQARIESKIKRFFSITQSYRMLISLFAGVFCRLSSADLGVFENNPSGGIEIFEAAIQLSMNNLVECDHSLLIRSLSNCHQIILKVLINHYETSTGISCMKMNNLMSLIQNNKRSKFETISHRFDQISTFNAVLDLVAMKYVSVKPLPISSFSEISFIGNPNLRSYAYLQD